MLPYRTVAFLAAAVLSPLLVLAGCEQDRPPPGPTAPSPSSGTVPPAATSTPANPGDAARLEDVSSILARQTAVAVKPLECSYAPPDGGEIEEGLPYRLSFNETYEYEGDYDFFLRFETPAESGSS